MSSLFLMIASLYLAQVWDSQKDSQLPIRLLREKGLGDEYKECYRTMFKLDDLRWCLVAPTLTSHVWTS